MSDDLPDPHDEVLEPLHTTAEVAQRLRTTIPSVRQAIAEGQLRASLPLGRRVGWRISESALQEWLRNTEHPAGGNVQEAAS